MRTSFTILAAATLLCSAQGSQPFNCKPGCTKWGIACNYAICDGVAPGVAKWVVSDDHVKCPTYQAGVNMPFRPRGGRPFPNEEAKCLLGCDMGMVADGKGDCIDAKTKCDLDTSADPRWQWVPQPGDLYTSGGVCTRTEVALPVTGGACVSDLKCVSAVAAANTGCLAGVPASESLWRVRADTCSCEATKKILACYTTACLNDPTLGASMAASLATQKKALESKECAGGATDYGQQKTDCKAKGGEWVPTASGTDSSSSGHCVKEAGGAIEIDYGQKGAGSYQQLKDDCYAKNGVFFPRTVGGRPWSIINDDDRSSACMSQSEVVRLLLKHHEDPASSHQHPITEGIWLVTGGVALVALIVGGVVYARRRSRTQSTQGVLPMHAVVQDVQKSVVPGATICTTGDTLSGLFKPDEAGVPVAGIVKTDALQTS